MTWRGFITLATFFAASAFCFLAWVEIAKWSYGAVSAALNAWIGG